MVRSCAVLSGMGMIRLGTIFNSARSSCCRCNIVTRARAVIQTQRAVSALTCNNINRNKGLSFTTHATTDDSESPLINSMQLKIKEHLNADSVTVTDAYGDARHVSISVVSAAFEGKSQVNRQRMVYKAIWEELQTSVHAVDHMSTITPQEAAAATPAPPNT